MENSLLNLAEGTAPWQRRQRCARDGPDAAGGQRAFWLEQRTFTPWFHIEPEFLLKTVWKKTFQALEKHHF